MSTPSTSSFVTEVLATAGRLEKEDLNVKLGALTKKTEELKAEVYDNLQKKYVDFYPNLMSAVELSTRVNELSKQMEGVTSKVEKEVKAQLTKSATEFQDLSAQLEETNIIMSVVGNFVQADSALQSCNDAIKTANYKQATASLNIIEKLLGQMTDPRYGEIKILQALKNSYAAQSQNLITDVAKAWTSTVKWDVSKEEGEKSKEDSDFRVTLSITKHKENMEQIVQAMNDLNILTPSIRTFGERFLKYIVNPVLTYNDLKTKQDISEESQVLSFHSRKKRKSNDIVTPQNAFTTLNLVFSFLMDNLFNISVNSSEGATPLMRILGSHIAKAFTEEFIINKCLSHSIPTSNKELESYKTVISLTEGFQEFLCKVQFLRDDTTLSDFVHDVNVLFANKKCQEILEKARGLMTSDIHNMVKIDQEISPSDLPPIGLEGTSSKKAKTVESAGLGGDKALSNGTFRLPTCQISESVQDLIDLCYSTLKEATDSDTTPQCALQLFYTTRNVLMLFCEVVPTYHKRSLEDLPQITALHHNDCMFLAHHLLTLGHQFRPKLPPPLSQGGATFMDLVPKLRRLGTEAFLHQMTKQREVILEYLAGAHGFVSVSEDGNYVKAERAIKQLLHQIQSLCNVWRDVLPYTVYNKSIGTLLNSALVEITSKVTSLEDMSADDATQLYALMTIITERGQHFYTIDTSGGTSENAQKSPRLLLHTYVRKWNKFSELMWILNAGLQDIADRWADGKGPLAAEFSANEVKQLIRAIFQNTDKRSQVLATIK